VLYGRGGKSGGRHDVSPLITPDGIGVKSPVWPVSWLTVTATLRLPGQLPSGISKGHYRIQSRGRLRYRAPQLGPPFLIPD